MAKKKINLMQTVQSIGAGAVGGIGADMIITTIEKEIAKKNPQNVKYASSIAAVLTTLGAVYTENGTLVNDALKGAAIVSATDLLQELTAKNPAPSTTGGTDGGTGGTDGGTALNGRVMTLRQPGLPGIRLNGGSNGITSQLKYYQ